MAQTQKKQQDMGTGDVKKLLLQLMIPAVVAQVVNLLYNIVDRIYIGHISGIGAAAYCCGGRNFAGYLFCMRCTQRMPYFQKQ